MFFFSAAELRGHHLRQFFTQVTHWKESRGHKVRADSFSFVFISKIAKVELVLFSVWLCTVIWLTE